MTGLTAHRLDSGGVSIAYQEGGEPTSQAMVLLHSLGADGRMWDGCLDRLTEDYRVIIPDSRGHGASGPVTTASVELWTTDLERVLDATGTDTAILVGLSLGGIQALAFAAEHPDRVTSLVVADSFAALPREVAREKIRHLNDQAIQGAMAAVADHYLADTFQHPYPPGAEAVRKAIAAMDADSYCAAVEACFGVRIEDRLSRIQAPTLVMWGERDAKTPFALSEQIASAVKDSQLVTIPAAGHLSSVDNPEGFTAEVVAFLAHQATSVGQQEGH